MAEESAAATSTNHEVDLGHLMAYDPSHHLAAAPSSRAELREECLRKATELAQAVANALFALPATEGRDGPVVSLPPPINRLPREKHVRIYHPSLSLPHPCSLVSTAFIC
jgi:regulator of ribosome biosynthesis